MRHATRMANVLSLLGALLATSLVLGLLAAGLVLPAVGATGQAAKKSVAMFNGLPDDFALNPLNQQSRILASDGSVIATPYDENRIVVPLSKIAPVMRQAQVAIEDKRFYQHGGVDPEGLARAAVSNMLNSGTQGASTLTQQYVKVVLIDQANDRGDQQAAQEAASRTGTQGYLRKLQQLKYSVTLEQKMTKDQILEGYLNTVYFGDQQYGVQAAALRYFGVPASKLSISQAATLAGIVQRPGATDPIHNPDASEKRRNTVLNRMLQQKYITQTQYDKARATKLKDDLNVSNYARPSCASSKNAYFCYYVQNWLLQQPALGKTPRERQQTLQAGGLTIQTSLDPKKVATINAQLRKRVPQGNDADVQAAAVMIQPGTGLVQAIGQNTTYSNTSAPGKTASDYALGGAVGFSTGSAAKLFALVTALNEGRKLDSTINVPRSDGRNRYDLPTTNFTRQDFPGGAANCGLGSRAWQLGNDHYVPSGPMSLAEATGKSINTAFATLVSDLGSCNVWKTTKSMGMKHVNGSDIFQTPSAITLGDNSSPMMLANAYATVASGGKYCAPRPVVSIKNTQGKALPLKVDKCKQVISAEVAAGVVKLLRAPLEMQGGTATNAKLAAGREAFGKTGTMNGAISTWFVGSTPQVTTAVWVGRAHDGANGSKTIQGGVLAPMRNIRLPGTNTGSDYVYGGTLAAPIWKSIMDATLKDQPKLTFPEPPQSMLGKSSDASPTSYQGPAQRRYQQPRPSRQPKPRTTANPPTAQRTVEPQPTSTQARPTATNPPASPRPTVTHQPTPPRSTVTYRPTPPRPPVTYRPTPPPVQP